MTARPFTDSACLSCPAHRPGHASTVRPRRPASAALAALAAFAALGCTACSSFAPPPSAGLLGLSLREAQAAQTRQPGASARPATGLDGAAARAAMQRYEQSSEAPARSAPVFNIGIGASSSR